LIDNKLDKGGFVPPPPPGLAIAPAYLDSELGLRAVLTPYTDPGIGIAGDASGYQLLKPRQ